MTRQHDRLGIVIGAAALTAIAVSVVILHALSSRRLLLALALTLIAAYAAYELVLFAATPLLGGAGALTPAIIARLGSLNLTWLIGLIAACEIARLINPYRRRHAPRITRSAERRVSG